MPSTCLRHLPALAVLAGAAGLPLLPGLSPALDLSCETRTVLLQTGDGSEEPCISAEAFGLSRSGPDISVQGVRIETNPPCGPLTDASVTTYRDRDGKEGFTNPPDELVSVTSAHNDVPFTELSVGTFTNNDGLNGRATHWELSVTYADGRGARASGTF